ncbi:hypothetical protein AB0K09_10340 [Streptomyces sp. NPDC049577]|uniref:hypothetical protein n=1 Tax=Streptomyces sp. NPDC049577 TaxID=3155153 RepID=UPI003429B67C
MPKHTYAAAVGPADGAAVPPLPDLTGVGLRALRGMADPDLSAAVESALRHPGEWWEIWYSSGNETLSDGPRAAREPG